MNNQHVKLYILYCANSVDSEELLREVNRNGDELRAIPLPCSGKIDILYLTKAFESGADGVAVVTCKYGECQYLEGNIRARKRVEAVGSLIGEIGLGEGRMLITQVDDGGVQGVIKKINELREKVKAMPYSAFKEDEFELDKE